MYARAKLFTISAHFRNSGFRWVSKPQKPVFISRTGPTTSFALAEYQNRKYGTDPSLHNMLLTLKSDPIQTLIIWYIQFYMFCVLSQVPKHFL